MLLCGILRLLSCFIGVFVDGSPSSGYYDGEWVTFHAFCLWVSMSGPCLLCLWAVATFGCMSSQYVNTMNCNVGVRVGRMGVKVCLGASIMHRILGLNLAIHWHGGLGHVHYVAGWVL